MDNQVVQEVVDLSVAFAVRRHVLVEPVGDIMEDSLQGLDS